MDEGILFLPPSYLRAVCQLDKSRIVDLQALVPLEGDFHGRVLIVGGDDGVDLEGVGRVGQRDDEARFLAHGEMGFWLNFSVIYANSVPNSLVSVKNSEHIEEHETSESTTEGEEGDGED